MTWRKKGPAPRGVIEIRDNGVPIGVTSFDENGHWTYNAIGLIEGQHAFTAHVSTASSSAWRLTVKQPAVLIRPYVAHNQVAPPDNSDKQTVAYYQINSDIDIVVPDYGMRPGETVKLYWTSRNTTYGSEIQTVANPPRPLSFKISKYEVIDAIGYSNTRVHYTVKRGTVESASHLLTVVVTGRVGEAPFTAPTLNPARDNIRVWKQAGIGSETTAEVRGLGTTEWQSSTQTFGSADYLNFPVSTAWLGANEGKSVRFNYSLRLKPADGNLYSFSQLLRINPL